MNPTSRQKHGYLYWFLGVLSCGLVIAGKILLVWAADTYAYSLPIAGGVLASLEIVEVTSPILLAILGLALGALTYYLAPQTSLIWRLLPLVLAFPIVVLLGYPVRHTLWVNQVEAQEDLSPAQAHQATDAFLQRETNQTGSLGFYWYTARQPKPPTRLGTLQTPEEANPLQNQLTALGRRQTGLLKLVFSVYTWLFAHAGWGLRAVYALLSGFAGLLYFYKGERWATRKRQQRPTGRPLVKQP